MNRPTPFASRAAGMPGADRWIGKYSGLQPPASSLPRSGFTLVELLVVIAIIAMLMALLVPAVQRAREAGRRTTCMNNQQQLSKGILNYATARDRFPSGFSPHPLSTAAAPVCMGWVPPLLPYIEQNPLYEQIQNNPLLVTQGAAAGIQSNPQISTLMCPSANPKPNAWAPLSYVVNAGMKDYYDPGETLDYQANGVFFDHYSTQYPTPSQHGPRVTTDLAYLNRNDGASLTVLLSENLDAEDWIGYRTPGVTPSYLPEANQLVQGSTWWQGIVWFTVPTIPTWNPANFLNRNTGLDISMRSDFNNTGNWILSSAKPSSEHPDGFLMTMCDGHTQFISEDIEYRVYALVMAPDSDGIKDPQTGQGAAGVYPGNTQPAISPWWTQSASGTTLTPVTEDDLTR